MPTPRAVYVLCRVVVGNVENNYWPLLLAAVLVAIWMAIDYAQFIDWLLGKLQSTELPFPI